VKKKMSCELESVNNNQNNKNSCSKESVVDVSKSNTKSNEGKAILNSDIKTEVDRRIETIQRSLPKITAEQESQLFYYRNQVKIGFDDAIEHENDPTHLNWKSRKGEIINKIAEGLEGCIKCNDPELEIKDKSQISVYIKEHLELRNSDCDTDYVHKILPEEFKRAYTKQDKEENSSFENLQTYKQKTAITSLYELAPEQIKKGWKEAKVAVDHYEFVAKHKQIALVSHIEDQVSITTPLPENPHETESYRAMTGLKQELIRWSKSAEKLEKKLRLFPIEDNTIDKETVDAFNQLRSMANAFSEYFDEIADLKATCSPLEWAELLSISEELGLGAAVSKSKAVDINGKRRAVTKKQLKISYKKKKEQLDNLIAAAKIMLDWIPKLANWKDQPSPRGGGVKPRVLARKNQLSPVLSEGAFGTSKGGYV
jgi:hypothetical protein